MITNSNRLEKRKTKDRKDRDRTYIFGKGADSSISILGNKRSRGGGVERQGIFGQFSCLNAVDRISKEGGATVGEPLRIHH